MDERSNTGVFGGSCNGARSKNINSFKGLAAGLCQNSYKIDDQVSVLYCAGNRTHGITNTGSEKMLFFKDCPFAMLVEESAIKLFLAKLEERTDIDWVFLVTNDQDSFARMCEWLPGHVPAMQRIHLWRNYVDNFLINVDRTAGEAP